MPGRTAKFVSAIFASNAGLRNPVQTTSVPSSGFCVTAASAEIDGGGFFDAGLTKVTGATNIIGNSGGPAIYNGATLRTEGPTTWRAGFVALGASNQTGPGTWENAGALRIVIARRPA